MRTIVVFGASGHAKVVIDLLKRTGEYEIAGLVERGGAETSTCLGYPVLGSDEALPELIERFQITGGIVAIGDNWLRHRVVQEITAVVPKFAFVTAVHPSARLGSGVRVGAGTVIMAGAVINAEARIGDFCIVNTNASVDHDSVMEDYSSVAPGVVTGGGVTIGRYAAIGLGARILERRNVGEHAVVGASATVIRDVPSCVVAYGTPAAVIRPRAPGDRYL